LPNIAACLEYSPTSLRPQFEFEEFSRNNSSSSSGGGGSSGADSAHTWTPVPFTAVDAICRDWPPVSPGGVGYTVMVNGSTNRYSTRAFPVHRGTLNSIRLPGSPNHYILVQSNASTSVQRQ